MSQPVIIPKKCLGCKSPRFGISEGVAHYGCGTTLALRAGRIKVARSQSCMDAGRCSEKGCPRPVLAAGYCRPHLIERHDPGAFQSADTAPSGKRHTSGQMGNRE